MIQKAISYKYYALLKIAQMFRIFRSQISKLFGKK